MTYSLTETQLFKLTAETSRLREELKPLLEEIKSNTNKKAARTLEFKMTTNSKEFYISPALDISDGEYGLGLVNFGVYHSIHNVDSSNNLFKYKETASDDWIEYHLPHGAYEVSQIQSCIVQQVGEWLTIKPILSISKCQLSFDDRYEIDFRPTNTIGKILGFDQLLSKQPVVSVNRKLTPKETRAVDETNIITFTSRKEINITTIDKVHMRCNHVEGSRLNGNMSDILFSFHIDVSPGYKIIKEPNPISYKRIPPRPSLETISFSFIDDDNKRVNFNGETITFALELRKM